VLVLKGPSGLLHYLCCKMSEWLLSKRFAQAGMQQQPEQPEQPEQGACGVHDCALHYHQTAVEAPVYVGVGCSDR